MPDGFAIPPDPAPKLRPAQREILVYLAALERAGRPPLSLKLLTHDTCVTVAVDRVRSECALLRGAELIGWQEVREPGQRRDNAVVLTDLGRPLAFDLLAAAGDEAPHFAPWQERDCMTCPATFLSEGPGNRMCPECRAEKL